MSAPNPSEQVVIRQINDHIITLSTPFIAFGHLKFGGRATLVCLTNGTVAVFSPISLTPQIRNVADELGPIKYIIAPNMEHYLFVKQWHDAYPKALTIAPEGLMEKRFISKEKGNGKTKDNFTLTFDIVKRTGGCNTIDSSFDRDFDTQFISAHFNKELVFNFRPTGTLIEGDLWFNLPADEQFSKSDLDPHAGFPTKLATKLHQSRGDSYLRRFMWYGFCLGHTKELAEQVKVIENWDFDSIIPCHGTVVERGGKSVFREVLQKYLAD